MGVIMKQYRARKSVRLASFLLLALSISQGIAGPICRAEERQVAGRYKVSGNTILHTITIPAQPPAAVIVVQYLPPGTQIASADPAYSSYDPATGEAKWLLKGVSPGVLQIRLTLAHEVNKDKIRAEALFKDAVGGSSTYALSPQPMKRKAVEGC